MFISETQTLPYFHNSCSSVLFSRAGENTGCEVLLCWLFFLRHVQIKAPWLQSFWLDSRGKIKFFNSSATTHASQGKFTSAGWRLTIFEPAQALQCRFVTSATTTKSKNLRATLHPFVVISQTSEESRYQTSKGFTSLLEPPA